MNTRAGAPSGRAWVMAGALLAGLVFSAPVGAQLLEEPELQAPEVALVGGAFDYELDQHGEGTVPIGGIRVIFPLSEYVSIGPSVAYAEYTADQVDPGATDRVRLTTLEFQVNGYYPMDRFRPYLGIGGGGVVDFRGDRGTDDFLALTVSLAVGVSVEVGQGWSALGEVRSRGISEVEHDAFELILGISTRF